MFVIGKKTDDDVAGANPTVFYFFVYARSWVNYTCAKVRTVRGQIWFGVFFDFSQATEKPCGPTRFCHRYN